MGLSGSLIGQSIGVRGACIRAHLGVRSNVFALEHTTVTSAVEFSYATTGFELADDLSEYGILALESLAQELPVQLLDDIMAPTAEPTLLRLELLRWPSSVYGAPQYVHDCEKWICKDHDGEGESKSQVYSDESIAALLKIRSTKRIVASFLKTTSHANCAALKAAGDCSTTFCANVDLDTGACLTNVLGGALCGASCGYCTLPPALAQLPKKPEEPNNPVPEPDFAALTRAKLDVSGFYSCWAIEFRNVKTKPWNANFFEANGGAAAR